MSAAIPDVLPPGTMRWFGKTQGPVVKMLPVFGQLPMRQLALRMRVLLCDCLLDDWSVKSTLSLLAV
ncbi:hypothetical protein TNCV_3776741 [Trichonephila clavipes]|nr:hypothetical protein TNCV_3776741 [Trichonephila clavipes]